MDKNVPMTEHLPWGIALLAARESSTELMLTLAKTMATLSKPTTVDLVVNGNIALAEACAGQIRSDATLRSGMAHVWVWFIAMGDKTHAWNSYLRAIWPGSEITFFLDGYVRPDEGAFERLDNGLRFVL